MPAPRILVVYATAHGQTAKIARHVADRLTTAGATVTLADVDTLDRSVSPRDFDGAIVASPILYGRHLRAIVRFVREHQAALNGMPAAFVSVSGSAASPRPAERAGAQACADAFVRATGWHPAHTALVGGAIEYTRYNFLLRWMLRRVVGQAGGPTDTSRDFEMTDWAQVARFADAFAAMVAGTARPAPSVVSASAS